MKYRKAYLIALLVANVICANILNYVGSGLMDEKGPIDIGSIYNIERFNL